MRDRIREAVRRFRWGPGNRGYVLLVSLGLLGILGLLATMFLRMTQVEQVASHTYVDQVRARMLAESGLERATGDVRGMEMKQAWLDPRDNWTYKEMYTSLEFPSGTFPQFKNLRAYGSPPKQLEDAVYVSYYDPAMTKTDKLGVTKGYSGALAGTYEPDGDTYSLKVVDCASQINVNNFDLPAAGGVPAHPGNPNLFTMLDNLGAIVGEAGLGNTLRTYITTRRGAGANGEFSSKLEMLAAFGGNTTRFNKVREFLTCQSWIDPKTVAFTKGAPMRWDLKPRAPIDVNTCAKEVLVVTLKDLSANYLKPDHAKAAYLARTITPVTQKMAEDMSDHIIKGRYTFGEPPDVGKYPYYDWMHFRFTVLDDMVGKVPGVTKEIADMVHANYNPNTDLKKLNPDLIASDPNPLVARDQISDLDKSDLANAAWKGTTELCWSSMGFYEIESIGRVYREGRIISEQKVSSVIKVYDVYRATTQKDFETDRYYTNSLFGSLVSADGYPAVVSLPEYNYGTTGGYRWKGPDRPTGVDPATDPSCAAYDGSLILSGMVKQIAGTNVTKKSFLAGYAKDTLAPDQSTCGHTGEPMYWGIPTQVLPSQVYGSASGDGKTWGYIDFNKGSDLHPFGFYSNTLKRNKLRTYFGDEVPVPDGTIEFFVKPEVDVSMWGRTIPDVINYVGPDPMGNYLVNVQKDGRLHMLDWGTAGGGGGYWGGGRVAKNELRIFTTKGRIFAHLRMIVGSAGQDIVLWQDVNWGAHTWHHVEVNWTGGKDVKDPNDPKGKPKHINGQFMFFIDGNATGPVDLPQDMKRGGINGNDGNTGYPFSSQDPWLIIGGKNYNSYAGWSMGFGDFIGTIDNFFMHKWRLHDRSFIPKSRYLDESMKELVKDESDKFGDRPVGVYIKRLKDVEAAASAQDLTLGTISCTHVHSWHIHAPGDHPAGKGHLSPGIIVGSGGKQDYLRYYDGCSGLALFKNVSGTDVQVTAHAGDELYYVATFERRSDLPALTSAILDDFTLTYFSSPRTVYRILEVLK